jgi:hypothetical protein
VPTIFRVGKARVMIYPNDHPPPHVHVIAAEKHAVVLIAQPARVLRIKGFSKAEMGRIVKEIGVQFELLMRHWDTIYGRQRSH